jgi:hypothetical protein
MLKGSVTVKFINFKATVHLKSLFLSWEYLFNEKVYINRQIKLLKQMVKVYDEHMNERKT